MPKTLFDALVMLQDAGCCGPCPSDPTSTTRTEIKPAKHGCMILEVKHQSSGVLASVVVDRDRGYTIFDDAFEEFERQIAEFNHT